MHCGGTSVAAAVREAQSSSVIIQVQMLRHNCGFVTVRTWFDVFCMASGCVLQIVREDVRNSDRVSRS